MVLDVRRVDDGRRGHDLVPRAELLEEVGGVLWPRPRLPKWQRPRPHPSSARGVLLDEDVDVVVARSDGPELTRRLLLEIGDRSRDLVPQRAVHDRVVDDDRVGAADAELDLLWISSSTVIEAARSVSAPAGRLVLTALTPHPMSNPTPLGEIASR